MIKGVFLLVFREFLSETFVPPFFRVPLFLALFAARLSDRSSFFFFGSRGRTVLFW